MAEIISGYYTTKSGPADNGHVTVTACPTDKIALDVQVCGGTVTSSPSESPSENPDTGDTLHINDSVDTTPASFPTIAGGTITSLLVEIPDQGDASIRVFVSLDGGILFKTLKENSSMTWSPRGALKQLVVYSNKVSPVDFEIIMNRNP